jgi:hypothetical protein
MLSSKPILLFTPLLFALLEGETPSFNAQDLTLLHLANLKTGCTG